MPQISSVTCPDYRRSADIRTECHWPSTYKLSWSTSPAVISGARVRVAGDFHLGESWRLTASNSVIRVDNDLKVDGAAVGEFRDVSFYVGKDALIGAGADVSFHGQTTVYTDGNLVLDDGGKTQFFGKSTFYIGGDFSLNGGANLTFHDHVTAYVDGDLYITGGTGLKFLGGATFHVNGSVYVLEGAWIGGSGGNDAPWVTFYVKEKVEITGAARAGAEIPDAVFLLDTDPAYSHHKVLFKGSGGLRGGIYAPTRTVTIESNSPITGSLVGKQLEIPAWRRESDFRPVQSARRADAVIRPEGGIQSAHIRWADGMARVADDGSLNVRLAEPWFKRKARKSCLSKLFVGIRRV